MANPETFWRSGEGDQVAWILLAVARRSGSTDWIHSLCLTFRNGFNSQAVYQLLSISEHPLSGANTPWLWNAPLAFVKSIVFKFLGKPDIWQVKRN